MTKLILAFHGADLALDDADLRTRLAATGVTRYQLNVDDEPVAAALRFGPGEPITAFVALWTDGNPEEAVAILTDLDAGLHAWRVTERRPIEPPAVPDGERADALANIAVLRRPEGMSRDDYMDIWIGSHSQIAMDTQNTFGYIQNIVDKALTPDAPEISAIVEELFPMAALTDVHEFYGSGGDDEELNRRITTLMTSVARFGADTGLDLVPTSRYVWELA
ncbi:EthD domain-containing protein [Aeromicrobium panaciterrae]|uniref:hypothetical protein n=1 Tax=Aeromicrobium panaciterrae TaxID=363861 RepID=UPI0031D64F51